MGKLIKVYIEEKINRQKDQVFQYLTDLKGYNEWLPKKGFFRGTKQISTGMPKKGTEFFDYTIFGRFKGEITEFEPPVKIAFSQRLKIFGVLLMESRPEYELQTTKNGTKVLHKGEAELFGLAKLYYPRAEKLAERERRRTVRGLTEALQAAAFA